MTAARHTYYSCAVSPSHLAIPSAVRPLIQRMGAVGVQLAELAEIVL